MEAIAKQWTAGEKHRMVKAVDKIHTLLKELNNPLMSAFVTQLVNTAVQEEAGIAKIGTINKKGKKIVDLTDKTNRIRAITEAMNKSTVNLVLFRDDEEVWMQYYMGKFLGKPTIIICQDEDREILKHYNVEDTLYPVEDYGNIDAKELGKSIQKVIKDETN